MLALPKEFTYPVQDCEKNRPFLEPKNLANSTTVKVPNLANSTTVKHKSASLKVSEMFRWLLVHRTLLMYRLNALEDVLTLYATRSPI